MSKGVILGKIWSIIRFRPSTIGCFNCLHSDKSKWSETSDDGICNLIAGLPFKIFRRGICAHHSDFNGGKFKHSVDDLVKKHT